MKTELERVKHERTNLMDQVRNDNELIDDKIKQAEKICMFKIKYININLTIYIIYFYSFDRY